MSLNSLSRKLHRLAANAGVALCPHCGRPISAADVAPEASRVAEEDFWRNATVDELREIRDVSERIAARTAGSAD